MLLLLRINPQPGVPEDTSPTPPPPPRKPQVFTQHLNSAIEQSSKEAMEDTLSDLRERLPFASAVSIVRGSIEGGLPPDDMLQTSLRSRLSSRLLQRSLSMALSSDDSLASTPLRISHSLPPPPQ